MDNNIKLELKLPKVKDIELVALESLEKIGNHFGIAEDKIGESKILITEAVINGLEHSGENKPYVIVRLNMSKDKLIILVEDFGKGFDQAKIEEPKIELKLKSNNKRGWGLKLLKSLSDDLTIDSNENGTKITIIKNLI